MAATSALIAALAAVPSAHAGQVRSAAYGPKMEAAGGHQVEYSLMAREANDPVGTPNVLVAECTVKSSGIYAEPLCWTKNQVTGAETRYDNKSVYGVDGGTAADAALTSDEPYLVCMQVALDMAHTVLGPVRCVPLR